MSRITSAFGATTTALEVVRGVDLSGRNAIVTGGASGIGVETARALAHAGAAVTLAVRDIAAGERVAAEIAATAPAGAPPVSSARLDLSDFAAIRAFAAGWGGRALHILVNNAGVMASPFMTTADGLEMQIGTNHFGHYLLTVLLAPSLLAGAEPGRAARVVSLSSIGHRRAAMDFDDPHFARREYEKWTAYGQSKTANALFAVGLDRRLGGRRVHANSVMPGGIMTPLQRHLERAEMEAFGWIDAEGRVNDRFKSLEQGASTSVWAAVGEELEGVGGLYLEDCAQALPFDRERPFSGVLPHALDPEGAERLWALSVHTTGEELPAG